MNKLQVIADQLEQVHKTELQIGFNKLKIEYQILDVYDDKKEGRRSIIIIPGFPSSFRNLKELNRLLALSGQRVIAPSFAGLGQSDNPPESWLGPNLFEKQSEVANQLLRRIGKKGWLFAVLGNSMGAVIATKLAKNYPEKISELILMHPAGVGAKQTELMMRSPYHFLGQWRSIKNKFKHNLVEQRRIKKAFIRMLKDGAKNLRPDRLKQRFLEIKLMAKGGLLKDIENFSGRIILISGSEDKLFPPKQLKEIEQH